MIVRKLIWPIPVAVRCKALFCGRSLPGIAGSKPVGRKDVCVVNVLCLCVCVCVRGFCNGPIPHREESYQVCVIGCDRVPL